MARLSDPELFDAYGPRCSGKSAVVSLNGRGKVTVALVIVEAVKALNAVLIAYEYVTRAGDTGAYNCRQKVGGNGWSIHALKIALDLNWLTNPYGPRLVTDFPPAMVTALLAIRTNSGAQVWSWGGAWSGNKDAMHWQIACSLRDLASGINWGTVAGYAPTSPPAAVVPAEKPPASIVTPPPYVGPIPNPTTADAPFEEDIMHIVYLRYDDGSTQTWAEVGTVNGRPGCAMHLTTKSATEQRALTSAHPGAGLVIGTAECDTQKSYWHEITFAEWKAAQAA